MTMFGRVARIVGLAAVLIASSASIAQAAPTDHHSASSTADFDAPDFAIDGSDDRLEVCVNNSSSGFITVTFEGRIVGQAPINVCNYVYLDPALPGGTISVVVSFSGDETVAPGSTIYDLHVQRRYTNVVVSPKRAVYGAGTTVTARVVTEYAAPPASGTMNFNVGGSYISAPVVNNIAKLQLGRTASAGSSEVKAVYYGDRSHDSSQGSGTLIITKAATTARAAVSRNGTYGSTAAVKVTVSGPVTRPTGTVSTTLGGKKYSATLNNGSAIVSLPSNWVGRKAVTFNYAGSRNFNVSSGRAVVSSVRGRSAMRGTAKTTQYGVAARMPVTVSGGGSAPTGRVTATIAGKGSAAGQLGNGRTTVSPSTSLEPGLYAVTLAYGGSALHTGSKASSTLTVSRARTSLSANSEPVGWYDRATVRVTVQATRLSPTGTISVYRGSKLLGSGRLSAGSANVKIAQLDPGWTDVTVKYSGDKRYVPTSGTTTVEVWAWD